MALNAKDCAELQKMAAGKGLGYRYDDLARLLRRAGCSPPVDPKGSHRVWRHPSGARLQLKDDGKRELLPAYVKEVSRNLLRLECANESR